MEQMGLSDPKDWVDKYGDYLFRSAILRVRDEVVAEEIVQETFLAALQARNRFAGHSSERTWLVGIMKHKITDHFRRVGREQPNPEADLAEKEIAARFDEAGHWRDPTAGPKEWADPASLVDRQQFWEAMRRCLGELPPRTASAFTLRELDDVPSDEICETLKITKSNLWVMLHRARAHLRRCLEVSYIGKMA